jgi:hypothetical protein
MSGPPIDTTAKSMAELRDRPRSSRDSPFAGIREKRGGIGPDYHEHAIGEARDLLRLETRNPGTGEARRLQSFP